MGQLEGKVALITGAAQGMGAAHVRRFVAEGAKVLVTDVQDEPGRALCEEIGDATHFAHLDVRSEADWTAAVEAAQTTFGDINVLVNNTGVQKMYPIRDTSLDDFRFLIDVNLIGTFLGMRAVVDSMARAGGGTIVNIASVAGLTAAGGGAYTASKHGVIGLSRVAALEFAEHGIRVNAVCPGPIDTPMAQKFNEESGVDILTQLGEALPVGRAGQPEEITNLVLFLASEQSSFSTGASFLADGGMLAGLML